MANWDWAQYATGGATRPDSFSGMSPQFSGALQQMFSAAPPDIQAQLRVSSGYRSPDRQAQLWSNAVAKYGSPEAARKWVAPPGRSNHNHGYAADLSFASPAAREWAHANAGQYGLSFPLSNENWHIELAGVRDAGGAGAPTVAQLAPQAMAIMTGAPIPGVPGGDKAAAPVLGNLASMFVQQQQARQQEEQAAAEARRVALLSEGLAGLYG